MKMRKQMILRCSNENVAIFFSRSPEIIVREITPETSDKEREAINEKPFLNKCEVKVWIYDLNKCIRYEFSVPEGYPYDGATIPWLFWKLIGPKSEPKFLVAAMIHDRVCEKKISIGSDRKLSSEIFYTLLIASSVGKIKASIMKFAVDLWQRTQGWER